MATIREVSPARWRKNLQMARFKGAAFHVEQRGRISGRRLVPHEYPKRDMPWTEDMGRSVLRYQTTGYVIQSSHTPPQGFGPMPMDYDIARDELIDALDSLGPGILLDPYLEDSHLLYPGIQFHCERYIMTEQRERGGYAQFEMVFIEAGIPGNMQASQSTSTALGIAADNAMNTAEAAANGVNAQDLISGDAKGPFGEPQASVEIGDLDIVGGGE